MFVYLIQFAQFLMVLVMHNFLKNCHHFKSALRSVSAGREFLLFCALTRPNRIVGQGYSQAGIFLGVLNVLLRAYVAQLGLLFNYGYSFGDLGSARQSPD